MKGAVFVDLNRKSKEKRILNNNLKAHINKEHLKYIALRDGVEIGCKGHGLFGTIDCKNQVENMNLKDITDLFSNASKNGAEIMKTVISLSEEDALKYGYNNKEKWQETINSKVREIAKEYGIKYSDLNFVVAFHPKENNPHCHLVFYDKSELEYKKKRKYVNFEKIRAELNKEIYSSELSKLYEIQNTSKGNIKNEFENVFNENVNLSKIKIDNNNSSIVNATKILHENTVNLEKGKEIFIYDKCFPSNFIKIKKGEKNNYFIEDRKINKIETIKYISVMNTPKTINDFKILEEKIKEEQEIRDEINIYTPFNTPNKYFSNRIYEKELNLLEEKIVEFINVNKKISYRYKYLTENQKKEINEISKIIIKTSPDIKKEFQNYINTKEEIAKTIYPDNLKEIKRRKEVAEDEMYIKIGNQLLKSIKEQKFKEYEENKEDYERLKNINIYKNMAVNKFLVFQNFLSTVFYNIQNENKRLNSQKNRINNKFSSLSKQAKKEKMMEKKNSSSIDWTR